MCTRSGLFFSEPSALISLNTLSRRAAISCRCAARLTERSKTQQMSTGRCSSAAAISIVSRSTAPLAPVVPTPTAPLTVMVASASRPTGSASRGSITSASRAMSTATAAPISS